MHLRQYRDPAVFISAPVMSRITGAWSFFLARRIEGPQGEFLGLVLSAIDIRLFRRLLPGDHLAGGGSVALFRRDGTMLARYPHAEGMIGQKLAPQSSFYPRVEEGGGTYRSPGYIDAVARIVSVHPLRDFHWSSQSPISEDAVLRRLAPPVDVHRSRHAVHGRRFRPPVLGAGGPLALARAIRGHVARKRSACRDFALTSSDWFWETDEKHRFTILSDHIRAFGQDPQTRIGRTRLDSPATPAANTAKWQEHFAGLERHEPFRDFVYTRKIGDDPERIVSVSGNPFFDEREGFSAIGERPATSPRRCWRSAPCGTRKLLPRPPTWRNLNSSANMSHELRTPLNAILGFSEVLENGIAGPLQSRQMEYIGLIRQSGEHLLHVINEILDLARIDAGKLQLYEEIVEPQRLVDECLAIVRDRAVAGCNSPLRRSRSRGAAGDGRPGAADGNPAQAAVERHQIHRARRLRHSLSTAEPRGGGVDFIVRDTGAGMTAAEIAVAVETFWSSGSRAVAPP